MGVKYLIIMYYNIYLLYLTVAYLRIFHGRVQPIFQAHVQLILAQNKLIYIY